MAGIAIILDLIRKNPSWTGKALHSHGGDLFSASIAASTAAASAAAGFPFASRALFGFSGRSIAYCDTGAVLSDEDYMSTIENVSERFFQHDSLRYRPKEYIIEPKPLFSAFQLRSLAVTTLRSFLLFYLPLLEPRTNTEESDDDFLQDASEEKHVDLIVPFKKSLKQIARETTVVTTRRGLERLAVHYFSQRMAWKLLKDVPKSAVRKADRGLPTSVFFFRVTRTTFRGHLLGVTASWLVQVGIDIYCFLSRAFKEDADTVDRKEVQILGKKVYGITIRCGASLVFASIGAGIGATVFRPSTGQWIGMESKDLPPNI